MAYLFKVLTLVLALCASPAFAGYAQLKPPPGWSQGLGAAVPGQAGVYNFGKAANAGTYRGTTVLTNAALNVAGQMVTVPVSMRIAANAATTAAQYSFGNPWLFATALAAPIAYQWFKDAGFTVKNGVWVKQDFDKLWGSQPNQGGASSASEACLANPPAPSPPYTFVFISVDERGDYADCKFDMRDAQGQSSGYRYKTVYKKPTSSPPGDPAFTPVGDIEFIETMAPKPMPNKVPKELPEVDWPVEQPVINPKVNPGVDPLPAPSPALNPQPLRVPVGEPQPVPNSNPQKWQQPVVDIVPAPTPEMPWRVDLQPKKLESDNSEGIKNPVPVPVPQPDPETGETPKDPAKPNETPGLCDEYPDILACQKLGEVEAKDLKNKTVPLEIKKDEGWNMAQASCPAPKVLTLGGKPYSFEITPLCDFATGIKPLVVGFAWISALLGFIGLSRKGD